MTQHQEYKFVTSDNINLFGQAWTTDKKPKAVLLMFHGLLEHSSAYENLARLMNQHSVQVLAIDIRGFGRSDTGSVRKLGFDKLAKDVELIVTEVDELFPDLPKILYGHDLGALLVLHYVSSKVRKIAGVVASSPLFRLEQKYPGTKLVQGSILKHIFPAMKWKLNFLLNEDTLDEKRLRDIQSDAQVETNIYVRLFLDIVEQARKIQKCVYKVNDMLLVMHGTEDRLTDLNQSKRFVQHTSDKTVLKEWEGAHHFLHKDDNLQEIADYLNSWMETFLKS